MKKISIALLAASLLVFSCKKKDKDEETTTPGVVTPVESKDILKSSGTSLNDDIVSFTQSEGADAISNLSNLLASSDSDPLSGLARKGESKSEIKAVYKDRVKNFRKLFVPEKLTNGRTTESFDFNENKGIYDWNSTTESFELSASSDKIIMKFPSVENGVNNDATLTLHSYAENTDMNPTKIVADLKVGTVKYVDLDFSATYSGDVPSTLKYTIYLKPFTNSLNYSDAGNSLKIVTSILKDGESSAVVSTDFALDFQDSDKEYLNKFDGGIYYRTIGVKGTVDAKSIDAIEEPTIADMNSFVNLQVVKSENNALIGDIEFFEDSEGNENIRIKFNDGSTELFETYFQSSFDELEKYMQSLETEEEEVAYAY